MNGFRNAGQKQGMKAFIITVLAALWLGGCASDAMDVADPDEAPAAAQEIGPVQQAKLAELQAQYEASQAAHKPAVPSVAPELNGMRVTVPGEPKVWLIDQGVRRHIPDPTTFERLFRNWDGIQQNPAFALIDEGRPISTQAQLLTASGTPKVFLVEPNSKRWITSPVVMDRYNFNWGTITWVPKFLLDAIPTGSNID
jgi:hypothetical protein